MPGFDLDGLGAKPGEAANHRYSTENKHLCPWEMVAEYQRFG